MFKLEWPAKDKNSSLLWTFLNFVRKKFYNIGPRTNICELSGLACLKKLAKDKHCDLLGNWVSDNEETSFDQGQTL